MTTDLNLNIIKDLPLGKKSSYAKAYDPTLLQAIPRSLNRSQLGIGEHNLPFTGFDVWNLYEISFLNKRNKPVVALGTIIVPADSLYIVESKSLKLYLNSFNFTQFDSLDHVTNTITKDLSKILDISIVVSLYNINDEKEFQLCLPAAKCIDELDLSIDTFDYSPSLLDDSCTDPIVEEQLISNLMKSNCLVTSQPDWGSIYISYKGHQIDHEKLLKYIVSFRNHNEFHEMCVERVFCDLMKYCKPQRLTVYARYTRRGGIDINPFRSNFEKEIPFKRLIRQ